MDGLTKMRNIKHFYLGFTNEWLGSLEPIDTYPKVKLLLIFSTFNVPFVIFGAEV